MYEKHTIAELIVIEAYSYLGTKEIAGNKGWYDKPFQALMKGVGWRYGRAWCDYFTELIISRVYETKYPNCLKVQQWIKKKFTANAQRSHHNLEFSGLKFTAIPEIGSKVTWGNYGKNGKLKISGHTGFVVESWQDMQLTQLKGYPVWGFKTIEGNQKNKVSECQHNTIPNQKRKLLGFIVFPNY